MVPQTLALAAVFWLLAAGATTARAEDAPSLDRDLMEIGRSDLALPQRLAAAHRVLAHEGALDAEAVAAAARSLMGAAPEPAGWLLLRAADAGWISGEERAALRREIALRWGALGPDEGPANALYAACGALVGLRPADLAEVLTAAWPPGGLVARVLEREIGTLGPAGEAETWDQAKTRGLLASTQPFATLLDRGTGDDPAAMRSALDALADAKDGACTALLLHEARLGVRGEPKGRMPRAVRAILVLGMRGDRAATPILGEALRSPDGWVRARAAVALGDLGDPAGAVALADHVRTLGDLYRARDQWDWPGKTGTNVPEADWRSIDYFNVDVLAADSLLRLGAPRAAGYLIHEMLDPSAKPHRIRVFQDAVDALRRSVPTSPWQNYNVDAGYPSRDAAFERLAMWWHVHRDDPSIVARHLDENDEGFRKAARALAERLRGKDVRQFMITKPACALLGRAMTPVLIELLATATVGSARVELSEALGLTRDPRAVPPLLALTADRLPFVRAAAAKALGAFAHDSAPAREKLLAMLDDPKGGPRVAAMAGLVRAPVSAEVLAAVKAHTEAEHKHSADYKTAETVVLLVQEGMAHWAAIEAGLRDERRFTRERWWLLLRRALDLPEWMHAAKAAPDAPNVRRLDKVRAVAALAARRGE